MRETPNFTGWRATILHRQDQTTDKLMRQLQLLGFRVSVQWDALSGDDLADMLFVDADQGWTGLLPWTSVDAPRPLIALLGSEAPGRIAWAMDHGAGAIIAKPMVASAVYPALVMALGIHQERLGLRQRMRALEERVRLRPLVHAAVQAIMRANQMGEEPAYAVLRSSAMRRRLPMEQVAALIVAGAEPLPEAG